ncbi:MAG: tetratricopeptide repeat protein [Bdellovibrio sp.]|nr:tetratricopeptide repeat protein [Bdellovibrio sp.]
MSFFKLSVFLAALILAACGSTKKELTEIERKAELYYSHGTKLLIEKHYTEALDALSKAYALTPNDSKVLNNLGMAYYFKGKMQLAEEHLKRSLELDNKNSDAKNNLASLFYTQGRLDEAKKSYQQILEDLVYQHQYRTYYNLALISLKQKQVGEAIIYLEKSLKERSDYCSAYYKLGEIYREKHSFNTALENFKEAYKGECYNDPAALYEQAVTLTMMRKNELAKEKFNEVCERFSQTQYAPLAMVQLKKLNADSEENVASQKIKTNMINPKVMDNNQIDDEVDLESYESPHF